MAQHHLRAAVIAPCGFHPSQHHGSFRIGRLIQKGPLQQMQSVFITAQSDVGVDHSAPERP